MVFVRGGERRVGWAPENVGGGCGGFQYGALVVKRE